MAVLAGVLGANAQAGEETLQLRRLGTFAKPVHMDNAPGFPRLLFVVEQAGRVRVMRAGQKLDHAFLDIRDLVQDEGFEEGLLSIAFDPAYEENRRFYVFYVNNGGDVQVDQFKRRPDTSTRALKKSRLNVITIQHDQAANHNGGQLQFDPDGYLYLSVGDGGTQGDPEDDAQDKTSLLGKLLRIIPGPKGGYSVPKTNPYVNAAGADEIYALGLRNPWRFSFDRRTGALFVADVGGSLWEEVNRTAPGAAIGGNFGWHNHEGPAHVREEEISGRIDPVLAYGHSGGRCSITGGYVVRDRTLSQLKGEYVYADFCAGKIRSFPPAEPAEDSPTGLNLLSPTSFGEGRRGRIYVSSLGGRVFRIVQVP